MKNQQRNTNPLGLLSSAILAAMIVLAGCGGDAEDSTAATGDPKVAEPAAEAAAPEAETMPEPAVVVAETVPASMSVVHGRVIFDGARPERSVLNSSSDPKCAILHGGEPILSELRVVSEDGGVQHAFVYVKNPPEGDYPVPAEPTVLDQTGCVYVPHILGMRAGQTLNVQNSDETTHNIRSFAKANKPFNISQPKPGIRERQFPTPEMAVKIKCDFHPWMTAYVFAMEHPFYAVTDENGQFSIAGLPDGDYTLGIWHEVWGRQEAELTVAGGTAETNFTFSE